MPRSEVLDAATVRLLLQTDASQRRLRLHYSPVPISSGFHFLLQPREKESGLPFDLRENKRRAQCSSLHLISDPRTQSATCLAPEAFSHQGVGTTAPPR